MNTELLLDLTGLADNELLAQVKHLARSERETTVRLVAHLSELDARKLYLGEACASLFTYCVDVLHFSEHAAYGRIQAARAARKFPVVLERLASGGLNLTTLGLLAPHLTLENHVRLLAAADHKSKREVEVIVAAIRPLPDVAAMIRRAPQASAGAGAAVVKVLSAAPALLAEPDPEVPAPAGAPAPAPARLERYKIQFTASAATHAKLRLAQELLRHQIPNGDPAEIIDRALSVLVAQLEKRKFAKLSEKKARRPEGAARPAAGRAADLSAHLRSQVWARDGGRCAFASADGHRCGAGGLLEFYRLQSGPPTADNVELRCGVHAGDEHPLDLASAIQQIGRNGDGILRESPGTYGSATGSGPSRGRTAPRHSDRAPRTCQWSRLSVSKPASASEPDRLPRAGRSTRPRRRRAHSYRTRPSRAHARRRADRNRQAAGLRDPRHRRSRAAQAWHSKARTRWSRSGRWGSRSASSPW